MHNRFRISQKILYGQILDVFLILPYFQIIRGKDNILVYFHQLMVEPLSFFSDPLLIYLDVIYANYARKSSW